MLCLVNFVVVLISLNYVNACNDGVQYHLSSKTPYRLVANTDHNLVQYEGCTPEKIWMITRHGTRNPSKKYIDIMKERLPVIKNHILKNKNGFLKSELDLLKKWNSKLDSSDEKKLTHEGENEMIDLAERMQSRYPGLLSNVYSNTSFKFRFTHTQRTKASAKYFAVGLFGKATAKEVYFPEPTKEDLILRFYKLCNNWRKDVKKNPNSLVERYKFQQSKVVKDTLQKIRVKIGNLDSLTLDDVHVIYMTCAFETAWSKKTNSPWCAVFDTESSKVFEYLEDLKYFWIDGYGSEITYKQACPTISNMMEFLDNKEAYPKSVLYFTHSGTILKVLSHLGLFNDNKPLTGDDFGKEIKWNVGKIGPFGTNIAVIKHKCGNVSKLEVRHQERVIRLPSCPTSDLCDIVTVKQYYRDSLESCDFNKLCGNTITKPAA